jgi:hypothetical protein
MMLKMLSADPDVNSTKYWISIKMSVFVLVDFLISKGSVDNALPSQSTTKLLNNVIASTAIPSIVEHVFQLRLPPPGMPYKSKLRNVLTQMPST